MSLPPYCDPCNAWGAHSTADCPGEPWASMPRLHGPCHGHPAYERVQRLWHRTYQARERLHPLHIIFTHRYERLTARMGELNDTLSFMQLNPWILHYAE